MDIEMASLGGKAYADMMESLCSSDSGRAGATWSPLLRCYLELFSKHGKSTESSSFVSEAFVSVA